MINVYLLKYCPTYIQYISRRLTVWLKDLDSILRKNMPGNNRNDIILILILRIQSEIADNY